MLSLRVLRNFVSQSFTPVYLETKGAIAREKEGLSSLVSCMSVMVIGQACSMDHIYYEQNLEMFAKV